MIEIFGFSLRLYGLIVAAGLMVGGWVSARIAVQEGFSRDIVWDALLWAAGFGIVGARLYHVVDLWGFYSQNLLQIFAVWNGGIGIFGALGGGLLGVWAFVRWGQGKFERKISFVEILDVAVVGVPLGQAIGRWGNFVNQELYGSPSDLPWALRVDPEFRLPGFEMVETYHPLFLYESMLSVVLFGLLFASYKSKKTGWKIGSGKLLGVYLAGYGLIRFMLEFLRLEKWLFGEVSVAQIVSVGVMVIGGWLVFKVKLQVTKSK